MKQNKRKETKLIYFDSNSIFEKTNNYHYLDSDILNQNICNVKNPVYLKYTQIADEIFYDRLVVTGWSVAITSQLFNAIKFLFNKGYDYAFYLVDDFICPNDFNLKIENILEKSKGYRNYFIKNKSQFNSWFAGFFFGFTIDNELIKIFSYLKEKKELAEEMLSQIKRHVDGAKHAQIVTEKEYFCSHCGHKWTEKSITYNGGCCEKDEEQNANQN